VIKNMNEATVLGKYIRISPTKLGRSAYLIRGIKVTEAKRRLEFAGNKSAEILLKRVNDGVSNAKNKGLKEENLLVKEVLIGPGPSAKRIRAGAQGRAKRILKKTSQLFIRLEELT